MPLDTLVEGDKAGEALGQGLPLPAPLLDREGVGEWDRVPKAREEEGQREGVRVPVALGSRGVGVGQPVGEREGEGDTEGVREPPPPSPPEGEGEMVGELQGDTLLLLPPEPLPEGQEVAVEFPTVRLPWTLRVMMGEGEVLVLPQRVGEWEVDVHPVPVPLTPLPADPVGALVLEARGEGVPVGQGDAVPLAPEGEEEGEGVDDPLRNELREADALEFPPVGVGKAEMVVLEEALGRPLPELEAQVVGEGVAQAVAVGVRVELGVKDPVTLSEEEGARGVALPLPLALPVGDTVPLPVVLALALGQALELPEVVWVADAEGEGVTLPVPVVEGEGEGQGDTDTVVLPLTVPVPLPLPLPPHKEGLGEAVAEALPAPPPLAEAAAEMLPPPPSVGVATPLKDPVGEGDTLVEGEKDGAEVGVEAPLLLPLAVPVPEGTWGEGVALPPVAVAPTDLVGLGLPDRVKDTEAVLPGVPLPHPEALGLWDQPALPLGGPVEALGKGVNVPLPLAEGVSEGEGLALREWVALREVLRQPLALRVGTAGEGVEPVPGEGVG